MVFSRMSKRWIAVLLTALLLFAAAGAQAQIELPFGDDDVMLLATTLRKGSSGSEVRKLQQNLVTLGYLNSSSVTGYFGDATENAVKQFQRMNGLTVDGLAGTRTLDKIAERIAQLSSTPSTSGSIYLDTSVTLRYGSRSEHVTKLQRALYWLGYLTVDNVTGYYAGNTTAAVEKYQVAKGLSQDGIAGRSTLASINTELSKTLAITISALPAGFVNTPYTFYLPDMIVNGLGKVTYSMTFYYNGQAVFTSGLEQFTFTPTQTGTYTVRLYVSDEAGRTASIDLPLVVNTQTPLTIAKPSVQYTYANEPFIVQAQTAGGTGDYLFNYVVINDADQMVAYEMGTKQTSMTFNNLPVGRYHARVTVWDGVTGLDSEYSDWITLTSHFTTPVQIGDIRAEISPDGKSIFIDRPVVTGGAGNGTYLLSYTIYDEKQNQINFFIDDQNQARVAVTPPYAGRFVVCVAAWDGASPEWVTKFSAWFTVGGSQTTTNLTVSELQSHAENGLAIVVSRPEISGGQTTNYTVTYTLYNNAGNKALWSFQSSAAVVAVLPGSDGDYKVGVKVSDGVTTIEKFTPVYKMTGYAAAKAADAQMASELHATYLEFDSMPADGFLSDLMAEPEPEAPVEDEVIVEIIAPETVETEPIEEFIDSDQTIVFEQSDEPAEEGIADNVIILEEDFNEGFEEQIGEAAETLAE